MACGDRHVSFTNRFCSECGMKLDVAKNLVDFIDTKVHGIEHGKLYKTIYDLVQDNVADHVDIVIYMNDIYCQINTFDQFKIDHKLPPELTFDQAVSNIGYLCMEFEIAGKNDVNILDIHELKSEDFRFLNFDNIYGGHQDINVEVKHRLYQLYGLYREMTESHEKELVRDVVKKLFA